MEKVLVTGATGFIGLHCVAQLLGQGYAVTGTLRSASRIDEVKQAMTEQQLATDNLSFVEADRRYSDPRTSTSEKEALKPKLAEVKLLFPQKLSEAEPSKTN